MNHESADRAVVIGTAPKEARTRSLAVGLLRTALVPLATVTVGLLALTAFASSGAAGAPPARIEVSGGRVLAPTNPGTTSAYFELRNTGRSGDTLLSVSSPGLGRVMIARTVVSHGAGRMSRVDGVYLPPGGRFAMTPEGTDLMVPSARSLTVGRAVEFDLRFAGSGTVRARAVVVPLGG